MRWKTVLLQLTLMNKFLAYIPNILLMVTHTLLTKMSRLIQLTQCKSTSPVIRVDLFPRLLNLNLSQAANFSGGQSKQNYFQFCGSLLRIYLLWLAVTLIIFTWFIIHAGRTQSAEEKLTLSRVHQLHSIKLLPHNGHELRKFFRNVFRKRQQSTTT